MAMDSRVVIVSACRTPFDKFGGAMRELSSIQLAVESMNNVMERVNLKKEDIDVIYYGTAVPSEEGQYGNSPGRQALLKAGFPADTTTLTVDRACCSSMAAFQLAYKDLLLGECDIAMAVGSENLSNVPILMPSKVRWGVKAMDVVSWDPMAHVGYDDWNPVSVDTENVANRYGITREEMDTWSVNSHQRYFAAKEAGNFDCEVVPFKIVDKKGNETIMKYDVSPRQDTNMEKMAKLKPVYGTKIITAGNAPGLNAGSAAIILMREETAKEYGLEPMAYVKAIAAVASEAENIPTVPAKAIQQLVKKAGISIKDVDVIEINEAFSAMPLVSTKILADGDEAELERLRSITNVNGGAVAIGHPMGATGARLIMTTMYELIRRGGGIGCAALCGGLAQGDGVMLEIPKK